MTEDHHMNADPKLKSIFALKIFGIKMETQRENAS